MGLAEEVVARHNERYLNLLVQFLDGASMKQALDAYQRLDRGGPDEWMGDNWLFAELGRRDLFYLLLRILRRPDIKKNEWLYARCREVEKSPDGHLDLWAREHYKSTIITFALTIQDILRDPEITVGIFSHTRPIAKGFLRQIKQEFEKNDYLKMLYPEIMWAEPKQDSPKWSEDDGIVVKRRGNMKESTVEAWGLVDGQPTAKHFKLMLYDDVVVKESVGTPEMMKKTTDAIELSYSLGVEGGVRRAVGTKYHFNDSYRTLVERGTFKVRMYDGTVDNCGDIKRPALWSPELMAEKRRDMGPYTFGCQILQNPRADATHGFQRGWLEYWMPDNGAGLTKYILRDPAHSKKDTADYTVDWVVGLGQDENIYVLAVYRDRLNLTQRTQQLFDLHRKWKPLEVRYEEYGLQADVEHIENEMITAKYRFKIIKVGGSMRKEERIKRLTPFFEQRRVILPRSFYVSTADHDNVDMIHEFVENEYMAFPVCVHFDMLDSLSRICETQGWQKGPGPDGWTRPEKVALELQWPAKVQHRPLNKVDIFKPFDPGAGYLFALFAIGLMFLDSLVRII